MTMPGMPAHLSPLEGFRQWMRIEYPGIVLRPWQERVISDLLSQQAAAGKSFLLHVLRLYECECENGFNLPLKSSGPHRDRYLASLSDRGLREREALAK